MQRQVFMALHIAPQVTGWGIGQFLLKHTLLIQDDYSIHTFFL